jgi:asparagine synthase (glutamine-hydrolysing)
MEWQSMAAIAGILRFDGAPVATREVCLLMSQMSHRAPDGTSSFTGEGIALMHGALHTTPESVHEHQPIRLGERWVLIVDGRIDNRDALARQFGLDAADRPQTGDASLFALAWARWGVDLWHHVEGDFALAVWDREQRRLTLLRDRIGARPLFFTRTTRLLAFASEPEPLLGLDGVSRVCDEDGLAYLLADAFEQEDQSRTFYRDVRRLRPGWRLYSAADGQHQVERYWRPEPGPALRLSDPREYVEAFRAVFDEAVRCRLRATVRPTLLLSGGIDSGAVLAAARRHQAPGSELALRPISLVETVEPVSSETENIRHLHAGADGTLVPIEQLRADPAFSEMLTAAWDDSHPIDNSILYARLACANVRDAGGRVALDGADGDSVMTSAASRAGALAASGHLLLALREARMASRVNTYLKGVPPSRILLRGLGVTLQPHWVAKWRYRRRDHREDGVAMGAWIDAGFARRLRLRERRLAAALAARDRRANVSRVERLAWTWWNPGFVRALEGTDRTYARFGVEARHPWCDQRIVEFFLRLPEEFKARDGWTKWIARAAYEPELGSEIAWYSGKSHLGTRLNSLVLEASHARVSALLERGQTLLAGAVDVEALARLQQAWDDDPARALERDGDAILHLASLAGWMERYRLQVT